MNPLQPAQQRLVSHHTEAADLDCLVPDPVVSVLMITYNHERYLAQAVEGVLSQRADFPIELIIAEDCSTDRTREIALEYQRRYSKFIRVLFSERNVGAHENFRRAALAARGKYIAFCEGDDWWHKPDKLSRQIALLERNSSLSLVGTGVRVVSDTGDVLYSQSTTLAKGDWKDIAWQTKLFTYDDVIYGRAWVMTLTVCCRTNTVRHLFLQQNARTNDDLPMGDKPLFLELLSTGQGAIIQYEAATYRRSLNSATRQKIPNWGHYFAYHDLEICIRSLRVYQLREGTEGTHRLLASYAKRQIRHAVAYGDPHLAEKAMQTLLAVSSGWHLSSRVWLFFGRQRITNKWVLQPALRLRRFLRTLSTRSVAGGCDSAALNSHLVRGRSV